MSKKKTSMQKGYRKQAKAKPFLTKKEIIALIVIVAAIALAVILFNLFYDDGFLGAKDVKEGDLVTYASGEIRNRYMKLAEVGEKEGFVRSYTGTEETPIGTYIFQPEVEEGNLDAFTVSGSFVGTDMLVDSFMSYATGSGVEVMEPVETTINGRPAYVFAYEAEYYSEANDPNAGNEGEAEAPVAAGEASESVEAAEPADNTFEQNISAYIAYDDTYTVALHVNYKGEDNSFYMPHDGIVDHIMQFTDVINMDFATE